MPGRGRAQGVPHEAWQGGSLSPYAFYMHFSWGKKSQVKISNHFWLLLQSLGGGLSTAGYPLALPIAAGRIAGLQEVTAHLSSMGIKHALCRASRCFRPNPALLLSSGQPRAGGSPVFCGELPLMSQGSTTRQRRAPTRMLFL